MKCHTPPATYASPYQIEPWEIDGEAEKSIEVELINVKEHFPEIAPEMSKRKQEAKITRRRGAKAAELRKQRDAETAARKEKEDARRKIDDRVLKGELTMEQYKRRSMIGKNCSKTLLADIC